MDIFLAHVRGRSTIMVTIKATQREKASFKEDYEEKTNENIFLFPLYRETPLSFSFLSLIHKNDFISFSYSEEFFYFFVYPILMLGFLSWVP